MKERPILFSASMVRALLAGMKTQTRRVVKPVGNDHSFVMTHMGEWWPYRSDDGESIVMADGCERPMRCPYGLSGDRLWVRETFALPDRRADNLPPWVYAADYADRPQHAWKPSIHMPRAASRITLEITSIRVERLQDISEADAIAEGISRTDSGSWLPGPCDHPEWAYHQLWDRINGAGSWDANPWVWVVEFKRVEGGER